MVMMRPKLGMDLQGIVAGDETYPKPDMTPMAKPAGGGFFGEGGMGRIIAGAIGDALLQNAGMQPVYAPAQRAMQQAALENVQWSRRRQAQNEDWLQHEQWQRDHPAPTEFDRTLEAAGIPKGSTDYATAMRRRVETQLNPVVPMQTTDAQGNPGVTWVPKNPPSSGMPSATPTVTDQSSYDALPPGAQYLDPAGHLRTKGGGAGNGAGGFHVPSGNPLSPYGGR